MAADRGGSTGSSAWRGIVGAVGDLAGRVPEPRRAHRLLERLTHPLRPYDYSSLVHPLWSSRELRGEVVSVRSEPGDAVTLVIRPGWGASASYRAGQYIGIGVLVDGRWTWRSYSLTEDPSRRSGEYSVTVRALPEGRLSNHIVGTVTPGTIVRLAAPAGDFTLPEPAPERILFLTAGSGMTPVVGMLRALRPRLAGGAGAPSVVHVHSERRAADTLFGDELRELDGESDAYRFVLRETGSEGRVDAAALDALVPDWREREIWACGPGGFLDTVSALATAAGRGDHVHIERFSVDRASGAEGGRVTFSHAHVETEADGATTLLEAGEKAGVLMPFGCRMGICQTCVVALGEGHVRDLRNGTEHGPGERIQTCVSVACGDVELDV